MDSFARALVVEILVTALGPEAESVTPLGAVAVRGYTDPVKVWRPDG